ncbi:MAG: gluconokinase [Rhodoferax sp.]
MMGVAGCGKSSAGQALASKLGLPLIEGDEFHPASNLDKMRQGPALAEQQGGAVLTCSALKRAYRDRLRAWVLDLRLVFLDIDPDTAHQRVTARAGEHLFPPSLEDSQFATLESPVVADWLKQPQKDALP